MLLAGPSKNQLSFLKELLDKTLRKATPSRQASQALHSPSISSLAIDSPLLTLRLK